MKSGKKKGKKALRDFAKTKHKSLPEKIKENFNHILTFDDFKYSV
jgi:succinate dehydrogenase flavin-adding protein (antitoxin of CptAB toxin-antitoxin module)